MAKFFITDTHFGEENIIRYENSNIPNANLFGHVHNSPLFKDYSNQHFCVSVERIEYAPISFEKIERLVQR